MDISSFLIASVSAYPWGSSAVIVIGILGYLLTHVFPLLPLPAPGATGFYPLFHHAWSVLAGNWGNATSGPVRVSPSGEVTPVPKQTQPAVNRPLANLAAFLLPIATVVGLMLLTSCANLGTPSGGATAPQSPAPQAVTPSAILNSVQAAYTLISTKEATLINTGVVNASTATKLKDADATIYAALVAFRANVAAGGKLDMPTVQALDAALNDLVNDAADIASITPATLSTMRTAIALLDGYLTLVSASGA